MEISQEVYWKNICSGNTAQWLIHTRLGVHSYAPLLFHVALLWNGSQMYSKSRFSKTSHGLVLQELNRSLNLGFNYSLPIPTKVCLTEIQIWWRKYRFHTCVSVCSSSENAPHWFSELSNGLLLTQKVMAVFLALHTGKKSFTSIYIALTCIFFIFFIIPQIKPLFCMSVSFSQWWSH